jgi:hypothetical protein
VKLFLADEALHGEMRRAASGAVIRNEWSGDEVASSNASNSQPQNRPQHPDAPLTTLAMMKRKTKKDWTVAEWVAFMKGKTELR